MAAETEEEFRLDIFFIKINTLWYYKKLRNLPVMYSTHSLLVQVI